MIPKLDNAVKHPVTPSSWKPSTDASVSPTNSDFTPTETPTKSSSSDHQSVEDINSTSMEETTEGATSKQEGKAPECEDTKANEDASPPKPEIPSTSKESTSTNSKAKKATCKKHAKDSKKKAKKRSKTVEADSSSDSDVSSSDSSSSSSSDASSDSSSDDDEAAKKKPKSKAKKAKKLKAKKRAKAKAKAEDTDSDSDDGSSSEEEEKKKKSKKRKQLKKKKRAKKSKEVEEEDDGEEDDDDDDDGDAALNRQQLAQLQAMNLKRIGRGRAGRGSTGETVNISGELGKKSAKAKGKPGKRSVFRKLSTSSSSSSIKLQKCELQLLSFATSVTNRLFRSRKRRTSRHSSGETLPWVNVTTCHFLLSCSLSTDIVFCTDGV